MDLNLRNSVIAAMMSFTAATPAFARDPAPPPSGVVIHLFGQNSIMSNILPTGSATPATAGTPAAAGSAVSAPGNANSAAQPASTYVEPNTGQILHQMFVTGDGSPVKPAAGRVADRPAS